MLKEFTKREMEDLIARFLLAHSTCVIATCADIGKALKEVFSW